MHQILSQSLKRWTYFVDDKCFTPLLYLLQIWIRFHTDSNFHCNFFNFASEKHNFSSAILVQISHILNFPFYNESFLQPCLPHLYWQIFNIVLSRKAFFRIWRIGLRPHLVPSVNRSPRNCCHLKIQQQPQQLPFIAHHVLLTYVLMGLLRRSSPQQQRY